MGTLDLGIDGLENIEQVGGGGSSRVFRAIQTDLDRMVAVKLLRASDDPDVARRFDRERRAVGRLSLNEGVVPIYSAGITVRGEPYMIMPYYPDGSLQDRIDAGPVPWQDAVTTIAEAAETMAAAHEAGVVHLDLKPANILLSSSGSPRIADFGIAKLMSEQTISTSTGQSFTPTFSAPETLLGGPASPASDVYGLAATLWALLAGRPPFRSDIRAENTLMAVLGRVVHQPPDDLRHLAPESICSVIDTAMAKDPADRHPTAGAFRRALISAVERADHSRRHPATGPADRAPHPAVAVAGPADRAPDPAVAVAAPAPIDDPRPTGSTAGLRFEASVPPRFVPAARAAPLADALDRYSGPAIGLVITALLVVVVVFGQRFLHADNPPQAVIGPQIVETDASSTSTARGAQAGAGRTGTIPFDARAPVRSTTTTAQATTAPTTRTTAAPTTPVTEPTTSQETASTTTTTATTTTTTTTVTTTTTATTTTTTTTPSSTTTSTTVGTTSSTSIPAQLEPPSAVAGELRGDRVVLTWVPPGSTDGLAGYTILRDGAPIGTVGPGAVRYVDGELPSVEPGASFAYQLRSEGPESGEPASSELSAPVEVTIPPDSSASTD